ncbi:MAG TPA: glycerophosphodiester phosphodiesterase [Gammaproteobacteria bacterium]|nr:glycerophosphodiester phosphodiesterase [Gammaproteobacteria bacterium]
MKRSRSETPSPGPVLVAHRGYPRHYPENTLPGIAAALHSGARYLEVDVQLSADGVPVLFHDVTLTRTTGNEGRILDRDFAVLQKLGAGEPARFGDRFRDVSIPALAQLAPLLADWPGATVFVEIKEESLAHFGTGPVVRAVLDALGPLGERVIPISYDRACLEAARHHGAARTGWVVRRPDEASREQARALRPDFLFCNHTRLGRTTLWPGPWHWVLYEITEPALARAWCRRGARFIETMAVGEMLAAL